MQLNSEHLQLRLGVRADIANILAYYKRNRDHFSSTNPPVPADFYETSYWVQRLPLSESEFQAGLSMRLFLSPTREPERIVGTVNFTNVIRGPFQACYLGYGIDQRFEGQGLMREALKTAIAYVFNDLHLHRIMANYLPGNARSGRLLAHLGFAREGEASDYLYIQGAWRSHILTSLTNSNWSPRAEDQKQFSL